MGQVPFSLEWQNQSWLCALAMQHHTGQFMQRYQTRKADTVRAPDRLLTAYDC